MSKTGYLTALEYKTIRILLGFSQEEAKEFHGVKNIRTIKRWESGQSRVSELACDKIMDLFKKINWVIGQGVRSYENLPEEVRQKTEVTLIFYPDSCYKKFAVGFENLPNSVHKTAVSRLFAELIERGVKVGIVEFNPQDYFSFMGANNYKDAQDVRALWAGDYYERLKKQNPELEKAEDNFN